MIYICIPTHNEQQTVGVVLWKLRQVLTDFPREYQLLVADDASTDKTPQVLEPYTRVLPLTVIRSERRQGAAASLEMLLREAVRRSEYPKRDVIVTLQADFSEEPDDLVPLVKRIEAGADVAAGNKVSGTKEPRARRFARSLATFFMRRQKWPEGVASPFDGYRAYRLHCVKRAMEERQGRLIRHDGWAGHAELLRAVLPHARRVDAVNVDDRPDRHQRARRERPFAAAMQVRVLGGGGEPAGLVGVEELDRIAATASRSRDRAALTAQSLGRGGEARSNGSARRQSGGGRRDSARRGPQSGDRKRAAPGDGRRPEGRTSRPRREDAAAQDRNGSKEEGARRQRPARSRSVGEESHPRSRKPEGAAADEPVQELDPAATPAAGSDAESAPPKKRRRRRKRGGKRSSAGAATNDAAETSSSPDATAGDAPGESAGDGAGPDASGDGASAGPKKRRRRGGRRGGRGRRRPKRDGAEDGAASDAGDAAADAAEPVARVEND